VTSVSRSVKYSRVNRFHSTTLPLEVRAYLRGRGAGEDVGQQDVNRQQLHPSSMAVRRAGGKR
jgi:hypothetical protein